MSNANYALLRDYVASHSANSRKTRGEWKHYKCPVCGDGGFRLGVNTRTGHIHCIRCGVSSNTGHGSSGYVVPEHVFSGVSFDHIYCDTPDMRNTDDAVVVRYATEKRRLYMPDPCVSVGRGPAIGCLVLLTLGEHGNVKYAQWRSLDPNDEQRYHNQKGSHPRLNFAGCGRREVLVLTEGAIDAVRVRQTTGLWASALHTTSISSGYLADLVLARPSVAIIMLDNDAAGKAGAKKLHGLLSESSVSSTIADFPEGFPKDAGEMTNEQIVTVVGNAIKKHQGEARHEHT